jgi:hypothetical protein
LETQDYGAELREREAIFLQTMNVVDEMGIAFAFPTRTLQIAPTPTETTTVKAIMSAAKAP